MDWLDTETKAILDRADEPRIAPPKAAEFGLVVLRKGGEDGRLARAIRRINDCVESRAIALSRSPVPITVNPGLTEAEALYGQFELICCDAVAVFVRSDVLEEQDDPNYLDSLFRRVLRSPEFEPARIDVLEVPATKEGREFVDQFLGELRSEERPGGGWSLRVPRKKARIMKHWAARVGATVRFDEGRDAGESAASGRRDTGPGGS